MAISVKRTHDFEGVARIINLPDGVGAQEPATIAQLNSAIEGTSWKESVRVSSPSNVNLASPGAAVNGITMVANDRVLLPNQTAPAENGIYIWNGAAVVMTRSLDANTFRELEQAIVPVEEGTYGGGSSFRQTVVNGVLGTDSVLWVPYASNAPPATSTTAGIVRLATTAETAAGTDASIAITPAGLSASGLLGRKSAATIGDGAATSFTITHNFGTRDVDVHVYRNSGNYDKVIAEVQRPTVNSVTVLFDVAPALNGFRAVVFLLP